ncbi:serine hydrolase [Tenacibaculum sp. IB213877]|uniref:serine hydrolase n=1 Tax=Tenacibaculum sp. IB213877 TaxID=3097351 RepID=UPI002A5A477B|nr:serine hydrolase [Tenacibaculum sp. IB213877]MDY0780608.1 serine hydrolase [Tenacibaculum sp. IB213877]
MKKLTTLFVAISIGISLGFVSYPIDGYEYTGIARLYRLKKMHDDSIKNRRLRPGSYKTMAEIQLNLLSRKNDSLNMLLTSTPEFEREIKRLFPRRGYSATVLDMTNPDSLKYAAFRENVGYQPGSVGKIAVLNAIMTQLSNLCPDSWEERAYYLKNIKVSSRYWGLGDHHTIPVYNIEKDTYRKRRVVASDVFSLYEWIDHMVSVSNNGAASVVFREAILMAAFEQDYFELTEEQAEQYFKETPRDSLTNLMHRVANEPLRKLGITKDEWRLGGLFTRPAGKYIGRKGGSIGTPVGLMKYLVQLEQGKVIDERTSLEIKRLLYLTDRRIRYAHSRKLDSAAVYFKSGSLYKCDREKNPDCAKYAGNVYNYMNSVIIVEHPKGKKYIVCLMSNVLNKNSAGAHMGLATRIDRIINPS